MDAMSRTAESRRKRVAAPEGYDTLEAFLVEARKRFEAAVAADRENREAGLDDLRFVAGEQWDEAVRTSRQRQGLACLTINTLPQMTGVVTAHDSDTGAMTVEAAAAAGGGTQAGWTISLSSSGGVLSIAGQSGVISAPAARAALEVLSATEARAFAIAAAAAL